MMYHTDPDCHTKCCTDNGYSEKQDQFHMDNTRQKHKSGKNKTSEMVKAGAPGEWASDTLHAAHILNLDNRMMTPSETPHVYVAPIPENLDLRNHDAPYRLIPSSRRLYRM